MARFSRMVAVHLLDDATSGDDVPMKRVNSSMQIAAIWLALWPVVAHAHVAPGQAVGLVMGFGTLGPDSTTFSR